MLAARSGQSYSALQLRNQQQHGARPDNSTCIPTPDKLLTDRSSYISYLESQLERVSAACLTVASYDERLESVTSAVRLLEEKVLNVARLVNCTQQYAEQQEQVQRDGVQEVARRLLALESRMEELFKPQKVLEQKLESVGKEVDAKLKEWTSTSAEHLEKVAEGLQQGLDAKCHDTHLQLGEHAAEATRRVCELERKLRSLDEYAHQTNTHTQVASLANRLGSMEDSVGHLAQASADVKQTLAAVEQAMGQIRTAVLALELRPPVDHAAHGTQDTLQWLARAQEALKAEIQSVLGQSQQMADSIQTAQQVAQEQPRSPHKALAAQVLSNKQGTLQDEVNKEVQALQLADNFIATVASQLSQSPRTIQPGGPAACPQHTCPPAAAAGALQLAAPAAAMVDNGVVQPVAAQPPQSGMSGWTIPAVPGALPQGSATAQDAAAAWSIPAAPAAAAQLASHWPPSAVGCASPGHMLLRVSDTQQLHMQSQPCSPHWAPPPAHGQWLPSSPSQNPGSGCGRQQAAALGGAGVAELGGGGLRGSLGQMQGMLESVCALLQGGAAPGTGMEPLDALAAIPSSRHLSRASTLKQPFGVDQAGTSMAAGTQPKRAWLPGGGGKPALAARSTSLRASTLDSAQAQKAVEERRRRLQQLYAELRQGT